MHLRRKQVSVIGFSAMAVGSAMLLLAGLLIVKDDSSSASKAPDANVFVPYATDYTPPPEDGKTSSAPTSSGSTTDPFASGSGDTSSHKVTITVTADGPIAVAYQYRDGGKKVASANRRFSKTATVDGPFPVARVFLQVISPSTFTKCAISIDGIKRVSYTAKGSGHFAVCTA